MSSNFHTRDPPTCPKCALFFVCSYPLPSVSLFFHSLCQLEPIPQTAASLLHLRASAPPSGTGNGETPTASSAMWDTLQHGVHSRGVKVCWQTLMLNIDWLCVHKGQIGVRGHLVHLFSVAMFQWSETHNISQFQASLLLSVYHQHELWPLLTLLLGLCIMQSDIKVHSC